jgi:Lar family restriction alleviation protein
MKIKPYQKTPYDKRLDNNETFHYNLEPCPFCGSTKIGMHSHVKTNHTVCHGCGTEGPRKQTPQAATEAWNTRPGHAELVDALDKILTTSGEVEFKISASSKWMNFIAASEAAYKVLAQNKVD